MYSKKRRFHLLPNAHLDPVWLWDWREGLSEGLTTVKTVLDLMDERPELTFNRGEAVIYRHIQQTSPKTFDRILAKIAEGRWDVVGGTWVQPDSNLSSVETLCRHFEYSLEYFQREVKVRPTIAWQADSFGHSAGWPNILRSFGMEGFAFTRPQRTEFPLENPAFWWNCDYNERLLCYRQHWKWYCSERFNVPEILDLTLQEACKMPWENVCVLIGLGNHGGGPSRKHLADVEKWQKSHPEVKVCYSTLHGFFRALRKEIESAPRGHIPEVRGEFGYCLRGCYSSVQKFKSLYRTAEAIVSSAETTDSLIPKTKPPGNLDEAWEAVLFNSFHDILPGSSIERAMEEQSAWTGLAIHHAQKMRLGALNRLVTEVDTTVPRPRQIDAPTDVPILLWNSWPREFHGPVEIEASLDYRPLFAYENRPDEVPVVLRDNKGRIMRFQEIPTEHSSMPTQPWRKRVVTNLSIPPLGWRIVRLGLAPTKPNPSKSDCRAKRGKTKSISNASWEIRCSDKLRIRRNGTEFLSGKSGIRLLVVEDPWGSWGGMNEERDSYCLDQIREEWKITESEILESGPERSRLWTRWQGQNSWADLTFDLTLESDWFVIQGRLLWNERSARLQMVFPSQGTAICDVPGSVVRRNERGQVPIGRWFHRSNGKGDLFGVASDVLNDVDFCPKESRLTLARASRYANDVLTQPHEKRWQPAVDCGELKFRLAVFTNGTDPDHIADHLNNPPIALPVTPSAGSKPALGSLGELIPHSARLLAVKTDAVGQLCLRVQNRSSSVINPKFRLGNQVHSLGPFGPQEIRSISL